MPRTEAGKRLLEREELNSRSFPLITAEAIEAIEREAAIPDRDALARALHIVSGMPHPEGSVLSEFECYCRRIATVDTTPDGPIDPGWGEVEFDPAAWGETAQSPTGCEMVATAIITKLEEL